MARLVIFEGGWDPASFELGDRTQVVLGRSRAADRVLELDRIARRHVKLERREGRWELNDLGSTNTAHVNGESARRPRLLEHEDVVSMLEVAFAFEDRGEERHSELEAAIVDHPGDKAPIAVWTDWLLERGDPLGDRLARIARGGPVPPVMRGGLDAEDQPWRAALKWSHGLLEAVELRSVGTPVHWRMLLSRILGLRSARFLRSLTVDLLGLAGPGGADVETVAAELAFRLPPSLEMLDLGYGLDRPSLVLTPAQAARLPRLRDRQVFKGRVRAKLVGRGKEWPVGPDLSLDARPGQTPSLSRRGPVGTGGWPAIDQATFFRDGGTWSLRVALALQQSLKVNGQAGRAHGLLPGDSIELDGAVFRFECE